MTIPSRDVGAEPKQVDMNPRLAGPGKEIAM
jgi:hypothetical protein